MEKTLQELISINSYSDSENEDIINYLIEKIEPYSKEIIKIKNPNNNKNNVLIGINTKIENVDAIVLSGHIDTVVPGANRLYKTGEIVEGKLYGLGVIDMKCYFASIIDNIEQIASLNKPIILAISCDEETNLCGINEIIKVMQERKVCPHNFNNWRANKFKCLQSK